MNQKTPKDDSYTCNSLLAILDQAMERGERVRKRKATGQISIFGDEAEPFPEIPYVPDDPEQRLAWEKELLGFYVSGHPLDAYAAWTEGALHTIAELEEGRLLHFCGLIDSVDVRTTKNGQPWAKVVISDRTGEVDVLCFRGAYSNYRELLKGGGLVTVTGRLKKDDFRSHFAKTDTEDSRFVFWAESFGDLAEYVGDLRRGAEAYSEAHRDWKAKRKENLMQKVQEKKEMVVIDL